MRRIIAFILCAIMCLALISSAYAADDPIVIGTTITLGEYEQDNNLGNGTEPIQWIVLDIQDSKALILSKYLIDTIMYNNKATYITWENCSLRNWLNDDFLSTAFDGEAQNSILLTNVKNDMGQGLDGLSVDGGNDTEDHIFLLSFQEVLQYFKTDTLRIAFPTDYAASLYGTPTWYTRSPGGDLARVIVIHADGNPWEGYVDYKDTFTRQHTWQGIRPAMWIDLDLVQKSQSFSVCADEFNELQDLEDRVAAMNSPADKRLYSTVTFGSYEQDNNTDNGKEPIDWLVLDIEDNSCLHVSKDILDVQKVMHWQTKISWEKCELRAWLNKEFLTAAFAEEEQAEIQESDLDNGNNRTRDRVFLLSFDEVGQYFPDDASRLCDVSLTSCALLSSREKKDITTRGWWTRSPPAVHTPSGWGSPAPAPIEGDSDHFEYVTTVGIRNDYVVDYLGGIRPAIRVNLDTISSQFPS